MDRPEVYRRIDGERDYQDQRWPGHEHSPQEWLTYIRSYTNEALEVGCRQDDATCLPQQLDNLRKIAALAVAAMENCGGRPRVHYHGS